MAAAAATNEKEASLYLMTHKSRVSRRDHEITKELSGLLVLLLSAVGCIITHFTST